MATVLIAGGTGLVGQRLSSMLAERGYVVTHLSRTENLNATYPTFAWDVDKGFLDERALQNVDYIVNLAGAGVADERWTAERKKQITESRTASNLLISNTLKKIQHQPKAYISAAAIGWYGDSGNELMTEKAEASRVGFLAESCRAWEKSIKNVATTLGIRTVWFRIGIVLSTEGGALPKMLLPFKVGLATYFGDGSQWQSWIHIDDLCAMFIRSIEDEKMDGVFNAVSPNPVTNKYFVKEIKNTFSTPALLLPAPSFALRLAMGEMADVVLGSTKVSCQKMLSIGFEFQFSYLADALRELLRPKATSPN